MELTVDIGQDVYDDLETAAKLEGKNLKSMASAMLSLGVKVFLNSKEDKTDPTTSILLKNSVRSNEILTELLHIVFDKPALSRQERAKNVLKRDYFAKYGDKAKKVLEALLEKYSDEGITALEDMEVLRVQPINEFGSPIEIVGYFGGRENYINAVQQMEQYIYMTA